MLTSLLHESPFWPVRAAAQRGKNGLTDQKIEIFKVHDIDTIIQQREKTHQIHLSLALKTFYDHMRRL